MLAASTLRNNIERAYNKTAELLPPTIAWRIDYLRPGLRGSWGGPLNGQRHRQAMVRELLQLIPFDEIVETGTYRGTSSEFFFHVSGRPVRTVEAHLRYHFYASRRLISYPEIEVTCGDSRSFLRKLATESAARRKAILFYLDAHWNEDLPLVEEIMVIASTWERCVIMIDDFEVPGDYGYAFDDYGPGKALTTAALPREALGGWGCFYPSVPAAQETGARRGCLVLASPKVVTRLGSAATLRREDVNPS